MSQYIYVVKPFNTISALLNKPFPEQESSFGLLKINLIISVFVVFFLFIFRPFGISQLESNTFLICTGFGLMTFLAALIFDLLIGKVLKLKGELEQWTFGKWMLYNLGVMLVISLANFLFARILIIGFIDWSLLPQMIYGTFMIGIIPIAVLGGVSILVQERKYQNIAKDINQTKEADPNSKVDENRTLFEIPLNRIKYIEALQNYVQIGHLDESGQFKKITERATIKNVEESTSGGSIVKAHRSFLVSKQAIVHISGNAQGLLLQLSDCDKNIPVSRSYVAAFRNQ